MTSNVKKWISHQSLIGSSSNFRFKLRGPNKNKNVVMKKTSNERQPPIEDDLKYWKLNILATTDQIFLKLSSGDQTKIKNCWIEDDHKLKRTSNWRWPKILKVEYLSKHWSDLPQILNISSGDQAKIKNVWNVDDLKWKTTFNGSWPQILKVEYLSNH